MIAPEPRAPLNVPAYSADPETGGDPVSSTCASLIVESMLCVAAWAGAAHATASPRTATTQMTFLMTYVLPHCSASARPMSAWSGETERGRR